mmetsp:Transcript_10471/g.36124  ORF Transcript_10471/g.36124 Transcript_10471/m.36124 type:complete len:274 (-) Transcript_10471:2214-3035(-)
MSAAAWADRNLWTALLRRPSLWLAEESGVREPKIMPNQDPPPASPPWSSAFALMSLADLTRNLTSSPVRSYSPSCKVSCRRFKAHSWPESGPSRVSTITKKPAAVAYALDWSDFSKSLVGWPASWKRRPQCTGSIFLATLTMTSAYTLRRCTSPSTVLKLYNPLGLAAAWTASALEYSFSSTVNTSHSRECEKCGCLAECCPSRSASSCLPWVSRYLSSGESKGWAFGRGENPCDADEARLALCCEIPTMELTPGLRPSGYTSLSNSSSGSGS